MLFRSDVSGECGVLHLLDELLPCSRRDDCSCRVVSHVSEIVVICQLRELPDELVERGCRLDPAEWLRDVGTRAVEVEEAGHVEADVDGVAEGAMLVLEDVEVVLDELAQGLLAVVG